MTHAQAAAVCLFITRWVCDVVPGVQFVRIDRATGNVSARDSLGWRQVGTVADFTSIARALGRI
jgi:hypothetical protein